MTFAMSTEANSTRAVRPSRLLFTRSLTLSRRDSGEISQQCLEFRLDSTCQEEPPNSEIRWLVVEPRYIESDTLGGQFAIDLGVWFTMNESILKL